MTAISNGEFTIRRFRQSRNSADGLHMQTNEPRVSRASDQAVRSNSTNLRESSSRAWLNLPADGSSA